MSDDILVDSSFLYALNSGGDKNHTVAVAFLKATQARLLIPEVTLPEVAHVLRQRVGQQAVLNFLDHTAQAAANLVALTEADIRRAHEIMATYASADYDLVDCCIMALSERLNIAGVCTFDRRDFSIFRPRHCDYLELFP